MFFFNIIASIVLSIVGTLMLNGLLRMFMPRSR